MKKSCRKGITLSSQKVGGWVDLWLRVSLVFSLYSPERWNCWQKTLLRGHTHLLIVSFAFLHAPLLQLFSSPLQQPIRLHESPAQHSTRPKNRCPVLMLNLKKTVASLFIASAWHNVSVHAFSLCFYPNKASLCVLGNTCIRLSMLGGKGHTPVSNWNVIMYELTWLQRQGAKKGGVIERWMPPCDVWPLPYSSVDIPEVMEHEWVCRLRADGEWTQVKFMCMPHRFFPAPKGENCFKTVELH